MVAVYSAQDWPKISVEANHVLGIACTGHGASLAYLGRDGQVRCSVLDRWANTKHTLMFAENEYQAIRQGQDPIDAGIRALLVAAFGRFPHYRIFEQDFPVWLEWLLQGTGAAAKDIQLVVTSDSHFATCSLRLASVLDRWLPSLRAVALIEHHDIHQRQAFWQSGFSQAAILTLDTCGESLDRLGGRKLAGTIASKSAGGGFQTHREFFFPECSAGLLYATVNHHVGFRQGDEGKTMGLAPYGTPALYDELAEQLELLPDGGFRFLNHGELKRELSAYVPARPPGGPLLPQHIDVAFAGQAVLERIVNNAIRACMELTGIRDLVYSGGVALNSVANGLAIAEQRPNRVYICPNPSDTGQALGSALAGAHELAKWPEPQCEMSDYLGPTYPADRVLAATNLARESGLYVDRPQDPNQLIACCIANGHIVARCAGRAEYGPRALGNRSILCDPRRPDMKDHLNARVKHREAFRPFAPSVLEECMGDWFRLEERSAYMLRVVAVHDGIRDRIPAVVHVDGSARVQTVSRAENPDYWQLIRAFQDLTGIPLVLNTSFNVDGRPIVETPENAVDCLLSTEIDVLFMVPYIISRKPLDEYVAIARTDSAPDCTLCKASHSTL
jgi:carbamoyltransferase